MKNLFYSWKQMSFLFVMIAAILSGCGDAENNANENSPAGNDEAGNEAADNDESSNNNGNTQNANDEGNEEAGGFPVTVADSTGQEVTIEEEPEKLISLLPSNTEIIFELGAGDRLIGISEYCNYPAEETAEIDTVGAQDMDAELILSLEPDVLFLQHYHVENHGDMIDQFEDAGIDILVVDGASSFEGVYDSIKIIGEATGTKEKADEIVSDMQSRIAEISDQAEENISEADMETVWVEVAPSPDIFTTGQGTFIHEMLETINAVNAAGDQEGWVNLSEEEMVSLSPDVIITTYGYYVDEPKEEVLSRDGWAEVPAVQDERIYDVDNDTVTRPGPRLVEGVETLAELIYPDVFE